MFSRIDRSWNGAGASRKGLRTFGQCQWALVIWIALSAAAYGQDEGIQFFENQVRPLLRRECLACHNAKNASGSLALDSRAGWKAGGDSGPAINLGEPQKSLLIRAIRHDDGVVPMPAKAPRLADEAIAALLKWVEMGAPDPRDEPEKLAPTGDAAWEETARERAKWWCWQPLRSSASGGGPPPTIDEFIDRGLAEAGIEAAPLADRRTLIRRLSFQLCGLPPTAAEVAAFLDDDRPDAWERCVDHFLARPDFGIHWGRHWLDVVRYGETHGSEDDALLPFSYRYRDYVIRAFNADLPYDQLVREHLAGDLLPARWNRELGINEALLGTAFYRFVEFNQTPVDVKREEIVVIDSQIDAIGKAFQALTISCARCHDHKFDPISDEDYYALYGILRSMRSGLRILDDPAQFSKGQAELLELQDQIREKIAAKWMTQVAQWPIQLDEARSWCAEHLTAESQWNEVQKQVPAEGWQRLLALALCQKEAKENKESAANPLASLTRMVAASDAGFAQAADEFQREQNGRRNPLPKLPTGCEMLFDLTTGDLEGWQITGTALSCDHWTRAGSWSIAGAAASPFVGLLERGYHTNAVSDRHGGSLRSPDFIIDSDEISILVRGSAGARARLVMENFQGDSLLFEGVNPTLNSPTLKWITLPIRPQWRGLRAHLEFLTRDDKPYIGVTKDPQVLEQSDGRSSFGLAQVAKHSRGARPLERSLYPVEILEAVNAPDRPNDRQQLVEAVSRATRQAINRWRDDRTTDADARWITHLIEARLLVCSDQADSEIGKLIAQYRTRENAIPIARRAPGVHEDHCAVNQAWLPRGDHRQPGQEIPRRYLTVLHSAAESYAGRESGRLQLAAEITSRTNPLTARVQVNRVWHWLFGRGIVATVDNFGRMGETPTHPELLDQLALDYLNDGWSTKRLIRKILMSRAWRRSSLPTASAAEKDPGNRWWSHTAIRRLEAESIRDTLLFVAGTMRETDGGLGTLGHYRVQQEPNKQSPSGPLDGAGRRSIFLEVRRNFPNEFLLAFDFPRPAASGGRRGTAVVPSQSLTLMNHPFVVLQSQRWAERVCSAESTFEKRLTRFYRDLFNREPTGDELAEANGLIENLSTRVGETRAWQTLAHGLFNLKEAIYLP